MRKSKSRFIKGIECQVCHRIGSLQILGNYYRIRHYQQLNPDTKKPEFIYHRNDKDYIEKILSNIKANSDLNNDLKSIINNQYDQNLKESSFKSETNSRNKFHQRILAFKA
jgi:hypothetical protein